MRKLVLDCPAKLNLFLEVLGRRPDGYHDIVTVMVPLDLADTIEFRKAPTYSLEVDGADLPRLNTVTQAWRAVRRRRLIPGVRVRLIKRIPPGSGLGGGSSDAAATIKALDILYDLGLDRTEVGAEVGSDVNFFLQSAPSLCTGRGEAVAPLATPSRLHAVVIWPGYPLSTADVYRQLRESTLRPARDVTSFLKCYACGQPGRIGRALFNRLETGAFALRPGLASLYHLMRRLPFAGVRMTGSGSALFGLCSSRADAERLARRTVRETGMFVVAVSTLPH